MSAARHRMVSEGMGLKREEQSRKGRYKGWLCALYLAAALLALGRTCVRCYPEAAQNARSFISGRAEQAFSALTDALGSGGSVREAFAAITGHEDQN